MASNFTHATFDKASGAVQYIDDSGRITIRSGGTLCWRTNNAGNLASPLDAQGNPCPRKTKNYIGFAKNSAKYQFFIFPDYATGRAELEASMKRLHWNQSIKESIYAYAPPGDNDTAGYIRFVVDRVGVSEDTIVKGLTPEQFKAMLDAIEHQEGYYNDADTQKITVMDATRLSISDSRSAVPNAQLQVQRGDQKATIASNANGAFPPIPHPTDGAPIKVSKQDSSGVWQEVLSIAAGAASQYVQLVQRAGEYVGISLSDSSARSDKQDPPAISYRVKPHDTLSQIAAQFHTSVGQLKALNDIKGDAIYPEQQLWINKHGGAVHPPAVSPKTPSKGKAPTRSASESAPAHKSTPDAAGSTASASSGGAPAGKGGTAASPDDKSTLDHVLSWFGSLGSAPSATTKLSAGTAAAIAKDGHISPVDPKAGQAPWMAIAIREAERFSGKVEKEITQTQNYHREVTEGDRAGGTPVAGKDGKPVLGKDGQPKKHFDGLPTLTGDGNPWCAAFVNYCLVEAGYPYARGHEDAGAFSYRANADKFFKLSAPIYGALRVSKRSGGHHVCFVLGKAGKDLLILGGNQDDQILFEELDETGLIGYYVPLLYKDHANKEIKDGAPADLDVAALKEYFGIDLFDSRRKQAKQAAAKAKHGKVKSDDKQTFS